MTTAELSAKIFKSAVLTVFILSVIGTATQIYSVYADQRREEKIVLLAFLKSFYYNALSLNVLKSNFTGRSSFSESTQVVSDGFLDDFKVDTALRINDLTISADDLQNLDKHVKKLDTSQLEICYHIGTDEKSVVIQQKIAGEDLVGVSYAKKTICIALLFFWSCLLFLSAAILWNYPEEASVEGYQELLLMCRFLPSDVNVAVVDASGQIVECSAGFAKAVGHSSAIEVYKKNVTEIIFAESLKKIPPSMYFSEDIFKPVAFKKADQKLKARGEAGVVWLGKYRLLYLNSSETPSGSLNV